MSEATGEVSKPFPCPDVISMPVTPGMDTELTRIFFDSVAKHGQKALVIIGFATGTTPECLNPYIQDLTQNGIPVFILSNNPGNTHGIREIKYDTQQQAVEAGAIPLRDVNVNNRLEVMKGIQESVNEGKAGPELAQAVIEKFGTPPRWIPKNSHTQA